MDAIKINRKIILWSVFLLYVGTLMVSILNHEPWGDELHSWNIAKCSPNLLELINNIRYEGHPPCWYVLLWIVSKCSHDFLYVQMIHVFFACVAGAMILFLSPFPLAARILLPFGYYFLFEYATLSRNYMLGIVCGLGLCILWHKSFTGKTLVYYILLLIMAQTHLLAALLGFSLHITKGFEWYQIQKIRRAISHFFIGSFIFLPIIYFLVPPADSGLNAEFWFSKVGKEHLFLLLQAPLKASFPLPAWWEHHFWNTQWLLQLHKEYGWLKPFNAVLSLSIVGVLTKIFADHRPSLVLFYIHVGCTVIFGIVFPLASARYVGFFWITCVVSAWLYYDNKKPSLFGQVWGMVFVVFQLISSLFVVSKEIQYPFSQSKNALHLTKQVPLHIPLVTDYWGLNTLSLVDLPSMYCLDLQEEKCFLEWNKSLTAVALYPDRPYTRGAKSFFATKKCTSFYFITNLSKKKLMHIDSSFYQTFSIVHVNESVGSIEKNSDLYLYKVMNK